MPCWQEVRNAADNDMKSNFPFLIRKEALHIWRDRRTLFIMLLIPVVLMLLFGFAISTEVNNVRVAAVATERSESIYNKVHEISASPYFEFKGFIDDDKTDYYLRTGRVDAVVVFARDYDRRVEQAANGMKVQPAVQIITDASNPNQARAAAMYLESVINGKPTRHDAFEVHLLYNPQMRSAYNFVPGIMGLIFILICALMTSVSIVREKETGTMELLLVSPVSPVKIIFAKMIPYLVISCAILTMILSIAYFILDIPLSGGIISIVAVSLLYLVLALSLGLFVSTLARTQIVAMLVSVAVMLFPIIMFSGMIFPIENLPRLLQMISYIVPARWYIDAMRKMMIEGLPVTEVFSDVAVLVVMTTALIGGSLKKFNNRL